MPFIKVIPENATIPEQAIEREIISREAAFRFADSEFQPDVVQRIEYDNEGQMSRVTSLCGESENRRSGENLPKLTVEGIITDDQLEDIKRMQQENSISMVSDIYTGQVVTRRLTIEQNQDLVTYRSGKNGQEETAYAFQLQLKKPE